MNFTSTIQKVRETPQARAAGMKIQSTGTRVQKTVNKNVQHGVEAKLQGKGRGATVYTTHTFKHARPGKSYTVKHTYGGGEGRVNLNYTHRVNRSIVSQHSANVNVRKVAAGAAVAYGGYKAYQNRGAIKAKAGQMHSGIHNAFHSTRGKLGAH